MKPSSEARAKRNLKRRQHDAAHRDDINEQKRQYRAARRDDINEQQRQYRAAHRDDINEQQRQYRAARHDDINEQQRQYRAARRDDINEQQRQYRAAHRDDINERKRQLYHVADRDDGNVAAFNTVKIMDRTTFEDHQHNIETAVMLFHHNSGLARFREIEDVASHDTELRNAAKVRLKKDILKQKLSHTEKSNLVEKFLEAQGTGGYKNAQYGRQGEKNADAITCASCGVRNLDAGDAKDDMKKYPLAELQCFQFRNGLDMNLEDLLKSDFQVEIPTSSEGHVKLVNPYEAYSFFRYFNHDDKHYQYYHLHREFVDAELNDDNNRDYSCFICSLCQKYMKDQSDKVLCLANGYDFGDYTRIGLSTLNNVERIILSSVRLYRLLIKLQHSKASIEGRQALKGHYVAFTHDAPFQAGNIFQQAVVLTDEATVTELLKTIKLCLVEEEGKIDQLMSNCMNLPNGIIYARGWVILQWLIVLKAVNNPHYSDVQLPSEEEIEKFLAVLKKELVKDALKVMDKHSIDYEKSLGDDVARVRTHNSIQFEESTVSTDESAIPMSLLSSLEDTYEAFSDKETNQHIIHSIAKLTGVSHNSSAEFFHTTTKTTKIPTSKRSSSALNTLTNFDFILTGSNPDTFMFGKAYRRNTHLMTSQIQHLLNQYTTHAASNTTLLFHLFNVRQRHQNINGVSSTLKSDKVSMKKFVSMVDNIDFKKKLAQAATDPEGDDAKSIIRTFLPLLRASGRNTSFGSMERRSGVSHMTAMTRRYGPASTFVTIAPDDINNLTGFRLTFRSVNNTTFPATMSEADVNAIRQGSDIIGEGHVKLPTSYKHRVKGVINNPHASSKEYKRLIEQVFGILVNIPVSYKHRKSSDYRQRGCGIFGEVIAFYGVTETQARGALHLHAILYGGLSPYLLQHAAHIDELCKEISHVLDDIFQAELSTEDHAHTMILKGLRDCNQ